MRNYCSLWDKNYLTKGVAMIDSLKRHSTEPYAIHILALDHDTRHVLSALGYSDNVYTVETFRDVAYFSPRPWREFCWTMASQFCEYLIKRGLPECTYLDADVFWFSSSEPIFAEIGNRSIAITPHRFIPSKKYLEATSGTFNVGLVHFKNTPVGRECLSTWAAQVRERCDESTCGDQRFLNSWCDDYGDEVCVIQDIGVNTAPWSVGNWRVTDGPLIDGVPIKLFHFHEFLERSDGSFRLTNYDLRAEDIDFIYKPYIRAIEATQSRLESIHLSA